MKIVDIQELTVPLEGNLSNSLVSFAEHNVSLIAVTTDVMRNGKPVVGYAFDSIGRFGQAGILRDRMIPRLMAARPESLLDATAENFDAQKVLQTIMRNEKPGGHGDRAAAAAALELAIWDLNAKLNDEPAWVTIARKFERAARAEGIDTYAAGGYYYPNDSLDRIREEFSGYQDAGFQYFKMKVGGASMKEDMARIEAVLSVVGDAGCLAVDANGRFDLATGLAYAEEIGPLGLRWYEEIGDPLDFDLNQRVAQTYPHAIATGENLFSIQDVKNLVLFGGMRPGKDFFQMDPGLSYGITEYAGMLEMLESHGFSRRCVHPHGGHLIGLHVAAGFELGGCEAYPGVLQPFGGYPAECGVGGGVIRPTDAPGFGLEQKDNLRPWLDRLTGRPC
ncbi:MAG: mandelate racemase [Methylibium sp.]|uniref:enolase C-terminal domain-like protein n=1 Tax=Methylibium sp. TaxID=2067992 RepID=UPI00182099F6|nr:enolase C-terminal domain-like protein [Methylibium sp.]MBA3599548.1 mandelate racemase [Methylibium sp.]